MTFRLSALIALAFAASVGLTACGDNDDRDDVEIEDSREGGDDD
ncbi:hypothetical protein [Aureimonas glaciei]|nr:hypothetical protein [Aureimonas glaciei]